MSAGRPARPTILKLITGENRPGRLHDDKPKQDGKPTPPPGTVLSEPEQRMFDWLLETVAVPGIHGTGDGAAFVKLCRIYVRVCDVDAKLAEFALREKLTEEEQKERMRWYRLSRDLWQQIGASLSEVGATPSGRAKLAGPRSPGGVSSWDQIT